jgi:hypothetical protein
LLVAAKFSAKKRDAVPVVPVVGPLTRFAPSRQN